MKKLEITDFKLRNSFWDGSHLRYCSCSSAVRAALAAPFLHKRQQFGLSLHPFYSHFIMVIFSISLSAGTGEGTDVYITWQQFLCFSWKPNLPFVDTNGKIHFILSELPTICDISFVIFPLSYYLNLI